ncbi:Thiamine-monophosphate kinase [Candidatus Protochlamydia naegleriophila]|uniref:Thiamine-monophosphate kinase n=1 Tax=Candidatus Protochlamydia naegleriophila TaxID=389348 RepID=A0A0U5JD78_9BACT|nr:thiamine-phosphate kinase [Candidatus Protochlamydia naegleriophila]CUI17111.1 Thiamine-monophosphate kinase [Candidatus Protochlamydia naegleriophila]
MKLHTLGEFGLIQRFSPFFTQNLPLGVEGIGDDCAIIPQNGQHSFLITTDLLIESIHFLTTTTSPEDLGYKSLAVSLSDIAGMGGKPLYAFLSIALPSTMEVDWVDRFFQGFRQLAESENVLLLGGDTTRSEEIAINVLVIGSAQTDHIKRRSQAKEGDIICSTGYLGDSGAGLKILLENLPHNPITEALIHQHVHPRPHLSEGEWLASQVGVHAMMDISDGLDSDIQHIMERSHCGAKLYLDKLPLSPSLKTCAKQYGWFAEEMAATAGEDYCLLATVNPNAYAALNLGYQQLFDRPLFKVGEITTGSTLSYLKDGQPFQLSKTGFDHFSAKS